ncbi:tetratricopeptide repeat protein [Spirochaetia bacterium]|nr:tetratricopeptide repeat protein [Spirochaetia bacterium]
MVFISYSHDSDDFCDKILDFSNELRKNGIDANIDQYEEDPPEGWSRWMEDQIRTAEYILVVCTKEYADKASLRTSTGLGVKWESSIIYNLLYEIGTVTTKFIPVIFNDANIDFILTPLRGKTIYNVSSPKQKEALQKRLLGIKNNVKPPLGTIKSMVAKIAKPDARLFIFPENNFSFRQNPNFTGRIEKFKEIRRNIKNGKKISLIQTQAIKGMGGVGKSEMAKEYAFRFAQEYSCMWWIEAETEPGIQTAYREFAIMKDLVTDSAKPDLILLKVTDWLRKNNEWLFIFDNAEDELLLEKYLPASGKGHILVTSRYQHWHNIETVDIDLLPEEESHDFLTKVTGLPIDEYQKELAKELGFLPLALEQAAYYIKKNSHSNVDYRQYLEMLKKHPAELLDDDSKKISKTVMKTFLIAIEKIENEAAKQLINICAFLAPENINCQWFVDASSILPQPLQDTVKDDYHYQKAKEVLNDYSLVKIENNKIKMHRLVQEVVKESLKKEKWINYCIDVLAKQLNFDFSTKQCRENFPEVRPHIETIISKYNIKIEIIVDLYHFLGKGFFEFANYKESKDNYDNALRIIDEIKRKTINHFLKIATINSDIASFYHKNGNYDDAVKSDKKALNIRIDKLGKEHIETAKSYNNLGLDYYNKGKYGVSLRYFNSALKIRINKLKKHPDTAKTYMNMANVYYMKGTPDNKNNFLNTALIYYKKSLNIYKELKENNINEALVYAGLGNVYVDINKYSLAIKYHNIALKIRSDFYGAENPNTAVSYDGLGNAIFNSKKNDVNARAEALDLFKKSLIIWKKYFGDKYYRVAETSFNIASVQEANGNYDEAKELFSNALSIWTEIGYNKKHTFIIQAESYIANCKQKLETDNKDQISQ